MASHPARTLFTTTNLLRRCFSSLSMPSHASRSLSVLRSLRPIYAAANFASFSSGAFTARSFSTRTTTLSLNDPSPNWSNRPPKETILLDGCDFEHWLVVMEKPEGDPTRDEIIDYYIKTLAQIVGSEEEARMKIYSVSTRCYYAFGALVSEELSYKIKELPKVRWVLPDSYLDVKNKDYGGEPFINGQAVPYDPKYHEEWIKNNARANERNRRNDRPRNFDRSRNFERRRENVQNRDFQSTRAASMDNQVVNNMSGPGGPPPPPPHNYSAGPPPPPPQNYSAGPPPSPHQNFSAGPPPPPPHNYSAGPPAPNSYPPPPNSYSPPPNMGGMPPNSGWSNNMPGNMQQNFQNGPDNRGMPHQGAPSNYQNYN
ncbi:hypothetical protein JCGZ_09835 [Jatropha curcas]|uniref:MORF/ORRM1/DAG-like MORF domain-containing protein n=1 Tax=Jatropha curcas TaxID=180498 RepID=A0A067KVJ4_JATCU|nr:multiple organellar RNA editing factor 8, chloroplastic/mitochondrial [Jatropha curcas]XP_020535621.1 multiple organellar RNA editing factor 8, chloroplastic/mitochondrial [Jatropha curcas]KDP36270.1 hypothetical protein JCGZ_09835 [Jatropha curcas]